MGWTLTLGAHVLPGSPPGSRIPATPPWPAPFHPWPPTWEARISSLCAPCRACTRDTRARGCRSLYQVTTGSGSESVSQLRMALSPARTETASRGLPGARLKVGGTGDRRQPSDSPWPSQPPTGSTYGAPQGHTVNWTLVAGQRLPGGGTASSRVEPSTGPRCPSLC